MKSPYILDLDRPRELRFGFKASREIRNKFGERKLESLLALKVDEIPALAFFGMKWDDKALTLNKVEDLLDDAIPKKYTVLKLTEIIINALAEHMGVERGETKKDKAGDKEKTEAKSEKQKVTETTLSSKKRKK